MKCKEIKEILFTDYLDGQLDSAAMEQVRKHLAGCPGCRELEEEIRLKAAAPFKDIQKEKVPDSVWYGIREELLERGKPRESFFRFTLPKPALAFATATIAVLIVFAAVIKYNLERSQMRDYFTEQMDFYSSLDNGDNDSGYVSETGTLTERYLF
jgi:anti-sigma factor RsiW